MATKAEKVSKLSAHVKDMQFVIDGLEIAKLESKIGTNMTVLGYNIMDIVHKSVKRDVKQAEAEIKKLTNIHLI